MKNKIIESLNLLTKHNFIWRPIEPLAKVGRYLCAVRDLNEKKKQLPLDQIFPIFSDKRVLNGPFKGLKYPSYQAVGSSLHAKLLGCYEREIHRILEYICDQKRYLQIVDVGCAEGYYAVGLSLRLPNATIHAYDIDENARKLCYNMAMVNNVEDRIIIKEYLNEEELEKLDLENGLIICDCEGYEKKLFNKRNVSSLKTCDLLIETHDFIDIEISDYLINLFSNTHDIEIIKSIDDIEKAKKYKYKETDHLNLRTKKIIFEERRPAIMEWLFCKAKEQIL